MIAFIRGILSEVLENSVLIDCHGMGYEVWIPARSFGRLPAIGNEVKLYTWLQVREDAVTLYGFTGKEELDTFKLLIGVSGIGPKGALGILSAITSDDLRFAVMMEDEKTIAKTPGIGPKTAKKLILELKDRFRQMDSRRDFTMPDAVSETGVQDGTKQIVADAIEALKALGFSATDAARAVNAVPLTEEMGTDAVIKQALKQMRG